MSLFAATGRSMISLLIICFNLNLATIIKKKIYGIEGQASLFVTIYSTDNILPFYILCEFPRQEDISVSSHILGTNILRFYHISTVESKCIMF